MIKISTLLLLIISFGAFAQTDTIYTNSNKIPCMVKEVTQDAVRYIYPGEEVINTVYKNTIQKIIYKSGRIQTFAEATSYKTVTGPNDFDNVTLTSVQSEVNGLFKLGDVSSKAKGTTSMASMEKVKERAYKKMKIVAAMMGANIIYLTQNATSGNQYGGYFQASKSTETNLAGVAYSNKLPSFDDFKKVIGSKTQFQSVDQYKMSQRNSDLDHTSFMRNIVISKIYNESGLIMVNAIIDREENTTFRVISYSVTDFTLVYKDGERTYNWVVPF